MKPPIVKRPPGPPVNPSRFAIFPAIGWLIWSLIIWALAVVTFFKFRFLDYDHVFAIQESVRHADRFNAWRNSRL